MLRGLHHAHSHDVSDSIDTALESSSRGARAVVISFVGLAVTSALQLAVIIASGSTALLADMIHNFSDALTAIPLLVAFRLGRRAPTRRYTYGFGRAEDLAGLFVIAVIASSVAVAATEAMRGIAHPSAVHHLGWVAVAGVVGFIGNELVAVYRIREGTVIGSAALVADGHHARADGFTSLAVVVGAFGVWAGWPAADPIAGLLISIAIMIVLWRAAIEILRRLMNGVDPQLVARLELGAARVPGVLGVHDVRVRWEGHRLHADLAVGVSGALAVGEAHDVAHTVEDVLRTDVAHLERVTVHVEPHHSRRTAAHLRAHEVATDDALP